jgi:hypothetical protein
MRNILRSIAARCVPRGIAPGYVLLTLLVPLLVLWLRDNPVFTPPAAADRWEFFGYFRNLAEFKLSGLGNPHGTYLAWLLPGAAIHSIFPPAVASALLHLGVQATAALSLFFILNWTCGARRAFVTVLVFSTNPWVWSAAGWDYPDGAGMAWFLLTLALLTWTARLDRPSPALALAGMALAGTVYAYPDWLPLAPLPVAYYLGMMKARHGAAIGRALVPFCLWFGAGCALATVCLVAVNYALDGHWFFYAAAIVGVVQDSAGNASWRHGLWWHDGPSPWLLIPLAAAVLAVAELISYGRAARRTITPALLFSCLLLYGFGWLALCQARGSALLGVSYRANVLLPLSFLVLGTGLWADLDGVSAAACRLYCWAAATALGCAWLSDGVATAFGLEYAGWWGVAAVAVSPLLPGVAAKCASVLAGLFLVTALGVGVTYVSAGPHDYRRQLDTMSQARQRLESIRHGQPVRFWHEPSESLPPSAVALISSYMGAGDWKLGNDLATPCAAGMTPLSLIAAVSGQTGVPDSPTPARSECWRSNGLRLVPVETGVYRERASAFRMSVLRIEVIPGAWQPVNLGPAADGRVALTPAPGARELATVRPSTDGLVVDTRTRPDAAAVRSPVFSAPDTGRYRFAVRYWPVYGSFRLGVSAPGESNRRLASSGKGVWNGSDFELECWADLDAGREFELVLSSAGQTAPRPASILVKSVSANRVTADSPATAANGR